MPDTRTPDAAARARAALALALALAISAPHTSGAERADSKVKFTAEQWEAMVSSNLALRVQSALADSASLRGTRVTVSADHEGNVTLGGEVGNAHQQQRAVRIASSVPGVKKVNDELDVQSSLADIKFEAVEDGKLARQVAEAIAAALPGSHAAKDWFFGYDVKGKSADGTEWSIDVEADDGVIELDGQLATNADVQTVLRTVRGIPSVRAVENDLRSHESRYLAYAPDRFKVAAERDHTHPATLVDAEGAVAGELVCQFAQPPRKVAGANAQ